jgi:hypothetical protein
MRSSGKEMSKHELNLEGIDPLCGGGDVALKLERIALTQANRGALYCTISY